MERNPHLHLWTREEYHRMADAGVLPIQRVELIEGQVVEMSPMQGPHAVTLVVAAEILGRAFREHLGQICHVRQQLPLVLSSLSEPEPDLAVVSGMARDYLQDHPTTALVIVEVSDSTLRFDRQIKGSLYARAGIEDYWILNLGDRCLEVYRSPVRDPNASYGFHYADQRIYQATDRVSPLVMPGIEIAGVDLLP